MLKFDQIEFLYLFYLIPVFIFLFWLLIRWQKRAIVSFAHISILKRLSPDFSVSKKIIKFILFIIGFVFLVVGLANPQIGTKLEEIKREGIDIIIALDVSKSMNAEDIKPNRMKSSLLSIARLIDKLTNDRIGLIVFAGEAFTQLPITTDYSAAKLFLNTINTDIVPVQGTAIDQAIKLASKSFTHGENKYKALIIITDGESHKGDAIEETKKAVETGIIVHTIGIGSPEGTPIPLYNDNQRIGFQKDQSGEVILTKLDEALLQEIAAVGKGKYVRATSRQDELSIILDEITSMEKKQFEAKVFTDYEDRFQFFIALALLFFVIELFVSERKSKWFESFVKK